ncbi:5,6-dimethylbenzimidazole synthase [Sphingomonas sp. R86521]|uniref:5,6-dimethylbenzimidazole synthase n=1 Tax=Sphingomonas sp. R86521 TaxID=3093860 RepID=UPI0036D2465C
MLSGPPTFDAAFGEQLETLFAWRRDVRRFRRDALPPGAVDRLLHLADLAPSVGNAQPWRFVLLDPAQRAALADHVDAASETAARAYDPDRATAYRALKLHGLREAPSAIAVFCDEAPAAGHGLGRATMPEMLRYSCVMAIHTIWLAARAQGIGLGWVSILDPDTVRTMVGADPSWSLIAILCLGCPEQDTEEPELQRLGWQARERRPR